jgi:ribonuclease T1
MNKAFAFCACLRGFVVVALTAALCAFAGSGSAFARSPQLIDELRVADLPREARDTLVRIKAGGPFAYRGDGKIFGNRERHLPLRERGYYLEYTVLTPGARDRGARRMVAGSGATGDVRTSGEYYYSADHFRSFGRVRE